MINARTLGFGWWSYRADPLALSSIYLPRFDRLDYLPPLTGSHPNNPSCNIMQCGTINCKFIRWNKKHIALESKCFRNLKLFICSSIQLLDGKKPFFCSKASYSGSNVWLDSGHTANRIYPRRYPRYCWSFFFLSVGLK